MAYIVAYPTGLDMSFMLTYISVILSDIHRESA